MRPEFVAVDADALKSQLRELHCGDDEMYDEDDDVAIDSMAETPTPFHPRVKRLQTHRAMHHGSFIVPHSVGAVTLRWSNEFSWWNAKHLTYKVLLDPLR